MSAGWIVCDLDGVVYLGDRPIEGSGRALSALEEAGFGVLFCTNNSWRTRRDSAQKVARVTGYPARPSQVLSSAVAAAALLSGSATRAYVVGGPGIREALTEVGVRSVARWQAAEAVVVGLDRELSYEKLTDASMAVRAGARFIATNLDTTFPSERGLLPGAGSIVASVATAAGAEPETAGKPFPPMRALIRARIGDSAVWVVGDRADTDLAMAAAEGWTAVLVMSGVTEDADDAEPVPDLVYPRLEQLVDRLVGEA